MVGMSAFDLENLKSRSLPRSNSLVTFEAWSSINMFAFRFVAIGPFLVEIQQIPYLILKIQGQGHRQGQTWWSHLRLNIQLMYLLFVSWQLDHFWLRYGKLIPYLTLTRQIWGIWKLRPAYSPETPNLGQNQWCFVPCDLEIWWMTLENNRASLLCCFKLCATFHSHWWIQTGVTVRKRPIWVKFVNFF